MSEILILDTETTSKDDAVIIEAAWLELISLAPFVALNPWCSRYNPGKPIALGALATHHILDEELVNCPPSSTFTLPASTKYIVGHNVDFDWKAIGSPDVKRICTLALARRHFPDLDSHSQGAILYYIHRNLAKDLLKNAHSALADVNICGLILKRICEDLNIKTIEELWDRSELARIPLIMPFGKHKGELLKDIPMDYKSWLLRQDDVDPYLRKALTA